MKSEKAKSVLGCGSVIVIILAIVFVVISQLDFFKSAHPQLSAWIALIAVISVPSFFVITGIVTDDKAAKSRKIRNICIYFAIVIVVVGGFFLLFIKSPKTTNKIASFIEEMDWDFDMQTTPDSSAFKEIGYEKTDHILVVTFRDSGDSYYYYDVPRDMWVEFKNADSLGSYFNEYIKGNYKYKAAE